jgi:lipopolysaccharide biosynthesis glycosyltransferase
MYPIGFFTDKKFLPMAQNMVRSLLMNNPSEDFIFYVVSEQLTKREVDFYFNSIAADCAKDGAKITFELILVNKDMIAGITDDHAFGYYPYYKLFLYKILPEHLEEILFLDVDLLIVGNIIPLFHIPLGECSFAGCIEHLISNKYAFEEEIIEAYHVNPDGNYYNAAMKEKLQHAEQDLFIMFFEDKFVTLPKRYNYQPYNWVKNNEQIEPVIVHFIGHIKPTDYRYMGKYFLEYQKYSKRNNKIGFLIKHYCYSIQLRVKWKVASILKYLKLNGVLDRRK